MADPGILGGKPCIRGTRISVEFVLELMASGATGDDLVRAYPQLKREDVNAAMGFAAQSMRNDELLKLEIYR